MELLIQEGVARVAGVVDFNKNKLEELYNEADMKPMVNQVNIADCCTIPEVSNWYMLSDIFIGFVKTI